jgi:hypothetical protein
MPIPDLDRRSFVASSLTLAGALASGAAAQPKEVDAAHRGRGHVHHLPTERGLNLRLHARDQLYTQDRGSLDRLPNVVRNGW